MVMLMENQFLPPLSSLFYVYGADKLLLEGEENYQKRSYRNRCYILSSSGPLLISIPLKKGKNQRQHIRQVEISYEQNWQKEMRHKLQSAYGKSPFYPYYIEEYMECIENEEKYLYELNEKILKIVLRHLQYPGEVENTKFFQADYGADVCDLRNVFSPVNRNDGKWPQKFKYPQVFEDKLGFISNLSVLDLIFNVGPESALILENNRLECPSKNK